MAAQLHKAIYFDDYQSENGKAKSFALAFTEDEAELYAVDGPEVDLGDHGRKIYFIDPADADHVRAFRSGRRSMPCLGGT